jgi:hypothetical protein
MERLRTSWPSAIRQARANVLHNARSHIAVQNLDVYGATSTPEPLNLTEKWTFVRENCFTKEGLPNGACTILSKLSLTSRDLVPQRLPH